MYSMDSLPSPLQAAHLVLGGLVGLHFVCKVSSCTWLPLCLLECAQGAFAVDIVSSRDVLLLSKLAKMS